MKLITEHKRLRILWRKMHDRCSEKYKDHSPRAYKHYYARGITVCDEWQDYFKFEEWSLLNGYSDLLSIDRIDNDAGYGPENCRWVSIKTNNRNKRTTKLDPWTVKVMRHVYKQGKTSYAELAAIVGANRSTVRHAINGLSWSDIND